MKRLQLPVAIALLGALGACDSLGPTRRTLLVQHYRAECQGEGLFLCLLVKEPEEPDFSRLYQSIEGFVYHWGYVYELEVEEHPVPNPPADASSIRTVLRAIVSEQRVSPGTEFELFLTSRQGRVVEVAGDRYRFYMAHEFICPAGARCSELRMQIAAGVRIKYRLAHPAAPSDPYTVVQWEVCDAGLDGSGVCSRTPV